MEFMKASLIACGLSIPIVLVTSLIVVVSSSETQQEESNQESPDFFSMSGLMIGMAGNLVMFYAFIIVTLKVGKAKPELLMPYVHFVLGEFRNDKKVKKLRFFGIRFKKGNIFEEESINKKTKVKGKTESVKTGEIEKKNLFSSLLQIKPELEEKYIQKKICSSLMGI
ncbi:MAG: hypothetical protein IH819_13510 [Bacteroidetes bacterium]|nr:hypothetical protein [Bacteroidota bacterium]